MRQLKRSWIEEYISWIEITSESPKPWHVWSAATIIGATLKRHVWIARGDWRLYPNLYTILVGHAGLGKGRAINPAVSILREAGTANIMSDSLTIQYILEELSKGFAQPVSSNGTITFGPESSCFISAPELEVFFSASEALPSLKELWEGKDGPYGYGTRGKGLYSISKPCPSLLGGCTPRQISVLLNSEAILGGFTRRVNFVYSNEVTQSIPWPVTSAQQDRKRDELINDLRHISTLQGEIKFSPSAAALFEAYYIACKKVDQFQDEALSSYMTTKWAHAAKLAMVLTCAREDAMVIEEEDMKLATAAIDQSGDSLERVFRASGDSDIASGADMVMRFLELKGFASQSELVEKLYRHISGPQMEIILSTLLQANLISKKDLGGKTVYKSNPRQQATSTVKGVTSQP